MNGDTEIHEAAVALGAIYERRPRGLAYLSRPGYEYWMTSPEPPHRWKWSSGDESPIWLEWHRLRGFDPHKRKGGYTLPKALRQLVIARDGYVCGLCGGDVESGDIHIDHIRPRSRGGSDKPENLQVAHSFCNISKGARA